MRLFLSTHHTGTLFFALCTGCCCFYSFPGIVAMTCCRNNFLFFYCAAANTAMTSRCFSGLCTSCINFLVCNFLMTCCRNFILFLYYRSTNSAMASFCFSWLCAGCRNFRIYNFLMLVFNLNFCLNIRSVKRCPIAGQCTA